MPTSDLTTVAALDLAALIRNRDVSCAEALEAHLRRTEAENPRLNAIVQLDADGARTTAAHADAAIARGNDLGPLHGVPYTVKDWIETEGLICAAGIAERREYRPRHDATVVARVRAAGGVLLGKTNCAGGGAVYPRPNNPHDVARTPGDSSSGDAAAVASGMSPFGLCSDSGGSIRLPAGWCGVPAIKPTRGRVPRTGHFPRMGELSDIRSDIGVIARSARDLHPLLAIIEGPDFCDGGIAPVPLGDPADVSIAGLRVARYMHMPEMDATASSVAAVEAACDALAAAGAIVTADRPPGIEESWPITKAYWSRPESASWNTWFTGREPSSMSGDDVEEHLFMWERFRRRVLEWMESYDLVVCPVAADVAPEHRRLTERDYLWTLPWSLTGYPVAVVRAGTSPEGMPVGVQLGAQPWRDDVAIAAAVAIEKALRM